MREKEKEKENVDPYKGRVYRNSLSIMFEDFQIKKSQGKIYLFEAEHQQK